MVTPGLSKHEVLTSNDIPLSTGQRFYFKGFQFNALYFSDNKSGKVIKYYASLFFVDDSYLNVLF